MSDKTMERIVIALLLILAVLTTALGLQSLVNLLEPEVQAQDAEAADLPGGVIRFTDQEAGVICYTYGSGGIDCLLIQETWLRE